MLVQSPERVCHYFFSTVSQIIHCTGIVVVWFYPFQVDRGMGISGEARIKFDVKREGKEHLASKEYSIKSLFSGTLCSLHKIGFNIYLCPPPHTPTPTFWGKKTCWYCAISLDHGLVSGCVDVTMWQSVSLTASWTPVKFPIDEYQDILFIS